MTAGVCPQNVPEDGTGKAGKNGRGRLFVISAPSGTGKTTLCRRMLRRFADLRYSVSYTSRPPRDGEIQGKDYHFVSRQTFERMIREGRFAEWAEVHGNYYGTSAGELERNLAAGRDILLDIDVKGARQILRRFPRSVTIFIMPPSMEALRRRLLQRNSDDPESVERRLQVAAEEMAARHAYRHVIVNDDLEQATAELTELIGGYIREKDREAESDH